MQSKSGGFGAFDVDNKSRLAAKLAFCDFGAVTDPPSSDVTAHVLETLAHEGRAGERAAARARSTGCSREQERDGSWFGRWGANYVYGTGAVLPALAACGLARPRERRAPRSRWLERRAESRRWLRRGSALLPRPLLERPRRLDRLADGLGAARPARRAARATAPRPRGAVAGSSRPSSADGGWDEPYYTGTGFPGDFYLNYHLYRDVFPVMALGRILGGAR